MFASASCLNILPLNQMIADFLPTKHIFTKTGPSFNKNRAVWCPLPSKHASSPIYFWGALYWIQTDHECYPALYKTSHGIGNLIQGFKWIATLPVLSASIFFFLLLSSGVACTVKKYFSLHLVYPACRRIAMSLFCLLS